MQTHRESQNFIDLSLHITIFQTCIWTWPNEIGVGWLCRCLGIVLEPSQRWAHMQPVGEPSATVVSARWATVDWFWHKVWNSFVQVNLHLKKQQHKSAGREWVVEHSPKILAGEEKTTTSTSTTILCEGVTLWSFNTLITTTPSPLPSTLLQHWLVWQAAFEWRQREKQMMTRAAQHSHMVLASRCFRGWLLYWRSRQTKKQYRGAVWFCFV